jgi:hypothetical protein
MATHTAHLCSGAQGVVTGEVSELHYDTAYLVLRCKWSGAARESPEPRSSGALQDVRTW